MPRRPQKAKNLDGEYQLVVRVPGWLKNQILAHCKSTGVSLNAWMANRLYLDLQAERGLPEPPQGRAPLPTPADQIRAWASGEKLLMPCGKTDCTPKLETVSGATYCKECRIRVS
jgi:hypothetical protein